jgi:hypothetical protein
MDEDNVNQCHQNKSSAGQSEQKGIFPVNQSRKGFGRSIRTEWKVHWSPALLVDEELQATIQVPPPVIRSAPQSCM